MQQFMLELWERTNITIFMITHDAEVVFLPPLNLPCGRSVPVSARRKFRQIAEAPKLLSIFHD